MNVQERLAQMAALEAKLEKVMAKSARRKTALKQTNHAITSLRLQNELNMSTIVRQEETIEDLRMELKRLQPVRSVG